MTLGTFFFYFLNFAIVGSVLIQQKERQTISFSEQVSRNALEFSTLEKITTFLLGLSFLLLIFKFIADF